MTKPGYKLTEIGEIPEEWGCYALGSSEISLVTKAGGTPLKAKKEYYDGGSIPFVKIEDIVNSGKYLHRTAVKITEQGVKNSSSWITPASSILFSMYASYGELTINKVPVATNQAILSIIPNKSKVDLEYLYYQLKSLKPHLSKYLRSTTQSNLNAGIVNSLLIPLSPLPEQQKMAEILSTADRKIELINKEIQATEQLKKGLMQTLLTKGIGHTKFKMTEIGEMPDEWEIKRLGEFVSLKNGLNFGKEAKGDSGTAVIDVLNMFGENIYAVTAGLYKINNTMDSDYLLQKGDILFVRSSLKKEGIGWASLTPNVAYPISFVGFIIRARVTDDKINPEFLTYFLRGDYSRRYLESHAGQVAITNISQETIQGILFPFISKSEQLRIVEILHTVDTKIEILKITKKKMELIKRRLMQELLTGKIRVKVESSKGEN